MVRVTVFGKHGCARCDTTRNKIRHYLAQWEVDHKVEMVFHDMDTVDGRAEGAFHDVYNVIPVTIVEADGQHLARWDGQVPQSETLRHAIEGPVHAAH